MKAILNLLMLGFALPGTVLLLVAVFLCLDTRSFQQKALYGKGIVVAQERDSLKSSPKSHSAPKIRWRPVVRFTAPSGDTFRFVDKLSSNPPRHALGDSVDVLWLPGDPHGACVDDFLSLWFSSLICAVLGGIFAGLAVATFFGKRYLAKRSIPDIATLLRQRLQ